MVYVLMQTICFHCNKLTEFIHTTWAYDPPDTQHLIYHSSTHIHFSTHITMFIINVSMDYLVNPKAFVLSCRVYLVLQVPLALPAVPEMPERE